MLSVFIYLFMVGCFVRIVIVILVGRFVILIWLKLIEVWKIFFSLVNVWFVMKM